MTQPGRNDPCPCGSGKKYKKCCMDKDAAPGQPKPPAAGNARLPLEDPFQETPHDTLPLTDSDAAAERYWESVSDALSQADSVEAQARIALRAIDEAPSFRGDDGYDLVSTLYEGIETAQDGQWLLNVMDAWRHKYPGSYDDYEPHLSFLRVRLAMFEEAGDLSAALRCAAGVAVLAPEEFESSILDILAFRGRTRMLQQAICDAWPHYLNHAEELGDELVLYFAYFGIRMLLVAEMQDVAPHGAHDAILRQMASTMAPPEEVEAFLHNQRQIAGSSDQHTIPVAAEVQRSAQLDPDVLNGLRDAINRLRMQHKWPETRIELTRIAWVSLLRQGWRTSHRLSRQLPLWRKLTPTATSFGRWKEQWATGPDPRFHRIAAWMASLPTWLEVNLSKAPVPPASAQAWADRVAALERSVCEYLDLSQDDCEQSRSGCRALSAWAKALPPPNQDSSPFLRQPLVAQLVNSGPNQLPELAKQLQQQGQEVLPALHDLMFQVAAEDSEPSRGASRGLFEAAIHAAFTCADTAHPSSIRPILDLAATSGSSDERLNRGLVYFPSQFGPEAAGQFLDFLKDDRAPSIHRNAVASGLIFLAGKHPSLQPAVCEALTAVLQSRPSGTYLAPLLLECALATRDPVVMQTAHRALEEDWADSRLYREFDSMSTRLAGNPWFQHSPPEMLSAEAHFQAVISDARKPQEEAGKASAKKQGTKTNNGPKPKSKGALKNPPKRR